MKYRVRHTTRYFYQTDVSDGQNTLVLKPRNTQNQTVERFDLRVAPEPKNLLERQDWFGNHLHEFALGKLHNRLEITSESWVWVEVPFIPLWNETPAWEAVRDQPPSQQTLAPYQLPSPLIPEAFPELLAYAQRSFTPGRPVVEAVMDLTQRIFADFAYVPGATEVNTQVREVFAARAGVCQDFAHLQLTMLRGLGLPARYVSGYLETQPPEGQPRLIGADASHAWVSVYVPELGWLDFDPTNNQMPTDRHITLAWGRDFGDVVPVKGFTTGGGEQELQVAVDVVALEQGPQPRLV